MNIKRALLTAAAVLMVPGLAMAQVTITFNTAVAYGPGIADDATFNARLECNTGAQLIQNFPISEGVPVKFIVEEFDPAFPNVYCEVSLTNGESGYRTTALANTHLLNENSCLYEAADDLYDAVAIETEIDNSCLFTFIQEPFDYTINKEWDFDDDEGVFQLAGIEYTCYNVYNSPPNKSKLAPSTYSDTYPVFMDYYDEMTVSYWANPWPVSGPYQASYCMAEEVFQYDSAVESDGGCDYREYFPVGKAEGECTITNSVFFEGIPTLSQYGLAIMALLMLGVGFVGFRRFV